MVNSGLRWFSKQHLTESRAAARVRFAASRTSPSKENGMEPNIEFRRHAKVRNRFPCGVCLTFLGEVCFSLWRGVRFRRFEQLYLEVLEIRVESRLHGSAWIVVPVRLPMTRKRQAPTPCSASDAASKTCVGLTSSNGGLAASRPPDQTHGTHPSLRDPQVRLLNRMRGCA